MNLRILLIGKNGQVGQELQKFLPRLGELTALGRQNLDLADIGAIRRTMRELRPHLIVNAAAYTAVDQAESDLAPAEALNTVAPIVMAEEAKKLGAALLHYSTDYVFDGRKKTPYREEDLPNPLGVYGRTKLAGERAIQDLGLPHLILRTSWVYGTGGRNFLLTILRLATQREELRIVNDQVGAPTWSRLIAAATVQILNRVYPPSSQASHLGEFSGVYHLTARGQTTWYGFARAILEECHDSSHLASWFEAATGGQPFRVRNVVPIQTDEYPTPAQRPAYSVLSNEKLLRNFGIQLPGWREQLRLALREADADDFRCIQASGLA